MRMIAEILECPFRLSIMGGEIQTQTKSKPEEIKSAGEEIQTEPPAQPQPQETVAAEKKEEPARQQDTEETQPDERDMTIGELYDIHEELNEMEKSIKAGESVEKAKEELAKKKKSRFSPGIFLRRKRSEEQEEKTESEPAAEAEAVREEPAFSQEEKKEEEPASVSEEPGTEQQEESADFEPVISREDSDEDPVVGEVNPYTGKEYQSNSVRMHPTRIGYVQVYDRSIHKWTDMTEWAFLGYQERKKTLLGKAYEPPIYLD